MLFGINYFSFFLCVTSPQNKHQTFTLLTPPLTCATPAVYRAWDDLGGPTANMYQMRCSKPEVESICRRLSCVHPKICKLLGTDHQPTIELMRKARRGGFVSIESDIEDPLNSATFAASPTLRDDDATRNLICDAFRLMALDLSDPARAEAHMGEAIRQTLDRRMKAVAALHTVADALPALGIVAAVLGIIRTMGSIDQSPAVLGAMIGSALLGTSLGVFLAYGVVGPLAARFGQVVEDEAVMLDTARNTLAAFGSGIQPATMIARFDAHPLVPILL